MGIPATESVAQMPLEEEAPQPRGKKDKDFHGRSPMQIALGRLRRDPVAVVCGIVVILRRPEIAWLGCAALPEACVAGTDPVAVAIERPRVAAAAAP